MRLWLLAIFMSVTLWLLTKLSQSYRIQISRLLWAGKACGVLGRTQIAIAGKGHEIIRRLSIFRDTLSLSRLCRETLPDRMTLQTSFSLDSLCGRIHPYPQNLQVEWVLPKDHDWVEPWKWIDGSDTLWSCAVPPSQKVILAAKPGLHLYPVVLPREWGVYPETLWIQGHLAPFFWVRYQVRPRVVGVGDYRVLLSPPALEVAFQVPRTYAKEISPRDIEVLVDMGKVLPQDTVAYLQVRAKKHYIRNLHFHPKMVRFTKIYGG